MNLGASNLAWEHLRLVGLWNHKIRSLWLSTFELWAKVHLYNVIPMGMKNGYNSEAIKAIKVIFIPYKDPMKTISQVENQWPWPNFQGHIVHFNNFLANLKRVARFVTLPCRPLGLNVREPPRSLYHLCKIQMDLIEIEVMVTSSCSHWNQWVSVYFCVWLWHQWSKMVVTLLGYPTDQYLSAGTIKGQFDLWPLSNRPKLTFTM